MAVDPVCGMEVDVDSSEVVTAVFRGQTFYFCAPGCKDAFEAEPSRYLR